jgi:transposase
MANRNKYSPEVKERAVRLVQDSLADYDSKWAAVRSIASKIGCSPETLRQWVNRAEAAEERGGQPSESERIKELEREVRELKRANEILRKASAYFAQAELDRPPKKW